MNAPLGQPAANKTIAVAAAAVTLLSLTSVATAAPGAGARRAGAPRMGALGIGDSYLPSAGNGGYDVAAYDVALGYRTGGQVTATTQIIATATQELSGFSLDFRGPRVTGVTVDGRAAGYRRDGQELIITPARALPRGGRFVTVVRYSGKPVPIRSKGLGTYGWVPTKDGAITLSEPDGTPTWLPVNDHPSDKATYAFHITVPKGLRVVANGEPSPARQTGAGTTYTWVERAPMASYLAMIAIGKFAVSRARAGRVPVIVAVDPQFRDSAKDLREVTVAAVKWESKVFGPYPFATAGGVIDDPRLQYALETQQRPVYAGFAPESDFVVHELAHQWFGNSVSLERWQDIWLNEGFATYAEWLWQEDRTKRSSSPDTAAKTFRRYFRQPADSPVFTPPPGNPGRDKMFAFSVYIRGAMCLQALRERIGDKAFFRTLKAWNRAHRHGNARTAQFAALAERESGKQLDNLFRTWLFAKGKPKWKV